MRADTLRGWRIREVPTNPVTGRWVATRWGVEMCSHSRDSLIAMIRARPAHWGAPVTTESLL